MRWDDTLVGTHSFASHLPRSLAHVVAVYCDSSPWKHLAGKAAGEEKGIAPWESDSAEDLLRYNASDCKLTALAWQRMQADLKPEQHVYECDKRMSAFCQRMTMTGIGIDRGKQHELSKRLHARRNALLAQLRGMAGRYFNPNALVHVRRVLYGKLAQRIVLRTPTGLPRTNNEMLEYLREKDTRAGRFADLLLRYRACTKVLGTYIDPIDPIEGRLHAPWKIGPITGRLAGPLLTLPRYEPDLETHVKAMYVAQKHPYARIPAQVHDALVIEVGGRYVYFDLSQAEARLAAHFSGDANLIAACESDIHLANALVGFAEIPEARARLERGNEKDPQTGKAWKKLPAAQGGCQEERDIIKNVGFCIWYEGSAERAFITLRAKGFPATMNACEELVNRFHARYAQYYRFIDENERFAQHHGYLRTVLLGRRVWTGSKPERTFIANYPIQSGIGDVQNERCPIIEQQIRKCSRPAEVREVLEEIWAQPIRIPQTDRSFLLPIEIKEGERWSEL